MTTANTTQATAIATAAPTKTAVNVTLWALQLYTAAMFFMAGSGKLTGNEMMVKAFEAIGFGQWFRILTGGIEVVAAVLLLVPSLAGVGAALLVPTMIGAIASHIFVLGGSFAPAAILLATSALIAYGRRGRTLALIKKD